MNAINAFIHACKTEPWEEWYGSTRLITADWLEERDREADAKLLRLLKPDAVAVSVSDPEPAILHRIVLMADVFTHFVLFSPGGVCVVPVVVTHGATTVQEAGGRTVFSVTHDTAGSVVFPGREGPGSAPTMHALFRWLGPPGNAKAGVTVSHIHMHDGYPVVTPNYGSQLHLYATPDDTRRFTRSRAVSILCGKGDDLFSIPPAPLWPE